jgi:hypothetical protein
MVRNIVTLLTNLDIAVTYLAVLIAVCGIVFVVLARKRKLPWQKPRIRIYPREKVIVNPGGKPPKCSVCRQLLEPGSAQSRCERDQNHAVHPECSELMHQKCPLCGGKLR